MGWLVRGLGSTVGTKFVAAITGLLLLLFVIVHLLGNLQVFLGPDALNSYAEKLQHLGALLWVLRGGLLVAFVLHVWAVLRLQLRNWGARPVAYVEKHPLKSTLASRTMIWTGLVVFAFIVYHLLHFTLGVTDPSAYALHDPLGRHDVYGMVVRGFQQPAVAATYAIAMILLFFHLKHGISSVFQSMGWNAPKYQGFTRALGRGLAAVIVVGNVAMPVLILLHVVGNP